MAASARSKRRWPSPPWSSCCCCVPRALRPYRRSYVVSTPHEKQLDWRRVETRPPPSWALVSPRRERRWTCVATADTSSPGSVAARHCCPAWSSSGKPSRPRSRVSDDTGAATVLAAVLIAALMAITLGGIRLGAAEVARHRAQAAADLAALAAAGRLSLGPDVACRQADYLAAAMRATMRECDVEQLDVVVSVTVRTMDWIGGEAVAVSRAGPAARPRSRSRRRLPDPHRRARRPSVGARSQFRRRFLRPARPG